MPGKWTPEHRAAFEASIEARQRARESGTTYVKPPRKPRISIDPIHDGLRLGADFDRAMTEVRAVLESTIGASVRALADSVSVERHDDMLERIRATAVRIEDALQVARATTSTQTPDAQLVAAMRTLTARIAALEASVAAIKRDDAEMLHLLRRIDSRPARVVEFRPDHKRQTEGGAPVRAQRQAQGLTKRQREPPRISPATGKVRKVRSDKVLGVGRPSLVDMLLGDDAG